jgi:hypothetical protein
MAVPKSDFCPALHGQLSCGLHLFFLFTFGQKTTEAQRMVSHETKENEEKVINTVYSAQQSEKFTTTIIV